jgi:hypothetical protein
MPSYALTPGVLAVLERRVLKHLEQLPDVSIMVRDIAIEDRVGTETFSTMENYPYSFLPPKTKSVNVKLQAHPTFGRPTHWQNVIVELSFGSDLLDSRLWVVFVGKDSRRFVRAIVEDINLCMAPYKTFRKWLHFPWAFVWLGASWLLPVIYDLFGSPRGWPFTSYATKMFLVASWLWLLPALLASRFTPYTQFQADEGKRGTLLRTLVVGVLASLLATFLYQLVRGGH